MIKSSESESQNKSKGAVIFAFNNESINYIKLAEINAQLIQKNLSLPTTLITDVEITNSAFDQIIIVENQEYNKRTFKWTSGNTETVNWRNIGRYNVYDLSPYDRTILLDADYIVNSNNLLSVVDSSAELSAYKSAYDVTGRNKFQVDELINFNSLDMYWATVIIFDKTPFVEQVFKLMKQVKENWQYYKDLYNFDQSMYRNDYAFTIAVNSMYGFANSFQSIPWPLASLGTDDTIKKIKDNSFVIEISSTNGTEAVNKLALWSGDLHIMNKHLISGKLLQDLLQ